MNVHRRFAVFIQAWAIELLLAVAIALLIGQRCWSAIVHWWRLPGAGKTEVDSFQAATLATEFVIQLPASYDIGNLWPLVVFLHGSGGRGNDPSIVRSPTIFHQRPPAIVTALQCLPSSSWKPDSLAGFIQYLTSRYHVDRHRIYLVGYSMGGNGAWQTAGTSRAFAAIAPINSGDYPKQATTMSKLPFWAFHGAKDAVVPVVTESEQMVKAMHGVGGELDIYKTVCQRTDLWK